MTRFQLHVKEWSTCTRCPLHEGRRKVVLARGKLPCDILFVGEAPGESEDVLGQPFVGPAGKLLDRIIKDAVEAAEVNPRIGFTNIVACIPRDLDGSKASEPLPDEIRKCSPRLRELIEIASPKLIVTVGLLADKWAPSSAVGWKGRWCGIVHPAAILRANEAQRGFMVQRAMVVLANALEDL